MKRAALLATLLAAVSFAYAETGPAKYSFYCRPYSGEFDSTGPIQLELTVAPSSTLSVSMPSRGARDVASFDPAYQPRVYKDMVRYKGFKNWPGVEILLSKDMLLGAAGKIRVQQRTEHSFHAEPKHCRPLGNKPS